MQWKLLGASALLALSLTACTTGKNAGQGAGTTTPNQTKTYGVNTDGNRINPMNNTGTGNMLNANSRFEVSQAIADQLVTLPEVKSANVLVTGNNAYVAVGLNYGSSVTNTGHPQTPGIQDVSGQVKDKIADKVRSVRPDIANVYVSANPDFVERAYALAQDVKNGRPISGVVNEFSNIVKRLFPANAGSMNPAGTGTANPAGKGSTTTSPAGGSTSR